MIKTIDRYKAPGNTVVVKPLVAKKQYGAILIPDDAQKEEFFEIISLGLKFESDFVKVGDIIVVNGKGGDRIDIQDGTYWIFPTKLIAATILGDEVLPIGKFVTLSKDETVEQKSGSIITGTNKDLKQAELEVINVGHEVKEAWPGDTILINREHCIEIETANKSVFLTNEQVVLAIVEE